MADVELIPGLEEFWAPDESAARLEADVFSQPPRFAPGRKLEKDYGVVYWGPWETAHDGVCVAVRRNAVALRRSGMPVHLQSPSFTHWNGGAAQRTYHCELPPEVLEEVGPLTDVDHARTIAWIKHFVPTTNMLQAMVTPHPMMPDPDVHRSLLRSTLAYVALESRVVPEDWVRALDKLGGVIVPCHANLEWLVGAGLRVPVTVVPHPLALKDPMRTAKRSDRTDVFRFLNVGKWEPRKNQFALIGAFMREFAPSDPVQLVLKSKPFWNVRGYPPSPAEAIEYWVGKLGSKWTVEQANASVKVFWKVWHTRERIAKLYGMCHAYVQAGSSEGFDLPALDAKVAGLPMATVGYGGPNDFGTISDVPIQYPGFVSPTQGYNMPEGTQWPLISPDAIGVALRELYERRAWPVQQFDVEPYLIDSVGAKLRQCIEPIALNIGVDLAGYRQ